MVQKKKSKTKKTSNKKPKVEGEKKAKRGRKFHNVMRIKAQGNYKKLGKSYAAHPCRTETISMMDQHAKFLTDRILWAISKKVRETTSRSNRSIDYPILKSAAMMALSNADPELRYKVAKDMERVHNQMLELTEKK